MNFIKKKNIIIQAMKSIKDIVIYKPYINNLLLKA